MNPNCRLCREQLAADVTLNNGVRVSESILQYRCCSLDRAAIQSLDFPNSAESAGSMRSNPELPTCFVATS